MKLKKLFKELREQRPIRRRYRTRFRIRFFIDDRNYIFSLLPTFIFVPWPYRTLGMPIVQFCWFNVSISFGEWDVRK